LLGAAYALHVHRDIFKRVAIVDFDVHHGNGTEEIINNLEPRYLTHNTTTPFVDASFKTLSYKPWLDENDKSNVFFAR
jgi:acetoin utilization deacetylase AcuC-like enzyme